MKIILCIILIYIYHISLNCYNSNKTNIGVKKTNIEILITKASLNEYLTDIEKNRLENYIDYKINHWNNIKQNLNK